MAADRDFQPRLGTALATFTQTGTYSVQVQLNGRLVGLYSDNYPAAAGSIDVRASYTPGGTGYKVQTPDGTVLKLSAFGSGTYYGIGKTPMFTEALAYIGLHVGTAGTAGAAAGGTIVLVAETR
jgi:hypothetical protein